MTWVGGQELACTNYRSGRRRRHTRWSSRLAPWQELANFATVALLMLLWLWRLISVLLLHLPLYCKRSCICFARFGFGILLFDCCVAVFVVVPVVVVVVVVDCFGLCLIVIGSCALLLLQWLLFIVIVIIVVMCFCCCCCSFCSCCMLF